MINATIKELQRASDHLAASDLKLAPLIAVTGPCTIKPHRHYYSELINSIISQQLSVKAAASIERRFKDLFGGHFPEPESIISKSIEELRSCGLSGAKANYIRDLANHILDGKLKFNRFDTMSNEEIASELTAVKGIGEWTAHMFLIFCMGRLDVLPTGDLGIRNGIKALYGLNTVPTPAQVKIISQEMGWHPYESVACWYIWHGLDNTPVNFSTD
jgi:DNA-3-methyladenine glycosylase II